MDKFKSLSEKESILSKFKSQYHRNSLGFSLYCLDISS